MINYQEIYGILKGVLINTFLLISVFLFFSEYSKYIGAYGELSLLFLSFFFLIFVKASLKQFIFVQITTFAIYYLILFFIPYVLINHSNI